MVHKLPAMSDIVIETPRLIMRPLAPGDAEAIAAIASKPEVGTMLGLVPCPCPVSHVETWIAAAPAQIAAGTDIPLTVRDKQSGTIIAGAGIDEMIDLGASGREYDLGYWFDPAWWGRGLAAECAVGMRDWAFETLRAGRLRAVCLQANPASARVLEKAGFMFTCTTLQNRPARGTNALCDNYRLDKPRWEHLTRANSPANSPESLTS